LLTLSIQGGSIGKLAQCALQGFWPREGGKFSPFLVRAQKVPIEAGGGASNDYGDCCGQLLQRQAS
jgi:hypothetical protein